MPELVLEQYTRCELPSITIVAEIQNPPVKVRMESNYLRCITTGNVVYEADNLQFDINENTVSQLRDLLNPMSVTWKVGAVETFKQNTASGNTEKPYLLIYELDGEEKKELLNMVFDVAEEVIPPTTDETDDNPDTDQNTEQPEETDSPSNDSDEPENNDDESTENVDPIIPSVDDVEALTLDEYSTIPPIVFSGNFESEEEVNVIVTPVNCKVKGFKTSTSKVYNSTTLFSYTPESLEDLNNEFASLKLSPETKEGVMLKISVNGDETVLTFEVAKTETSEENTEPSESDDPNSEPDVNDTEPDTDTTDETTENDSPDSVTDTESDNTENPTESPEEQTT